MRDLPIFSGDLKPFSKSKHITQPTDYLPNVVVHQNWDDRRPRRGAIHNMGALCRQTVHSSLRRNVSRFGNASHPLVSASETHSRNTCFLALRHIEKQL